MNVKGKILLTLAVVASGIVSASAQIYVSVRPTHAVVVRTPAPSPRHIWVDEDWHGHDGRYDYNGGRWVEPRDGYRYQPGRWNHDNHGDSWREGSWQRDGQRGRHRGHGGEHNGR